MLTGAARFDRDRLERELSHYRSLTKTNKQGLEGKPFLAVHLNFWMDSVRLLITALEFWDYTGNHAKYQETIDRIEKALKYMDKLIFSFDDQNDQDEDTYPEI